MRAAVLVVVAAASADDAPWKFLASYPAQLDALPCEKVTIDGVLDEPCWRKAPWTGPFEDIAQPLHPGARIPDSYQTKVAVAYDADALYVAAVLKETNLWATIRGHNEDLTDHKAPWWNQDFECFFDASRTTHNYVEFETNALNATYDVLWRVPQHGFDSLGVPCAPGAATWCGNSTFNGGNQTWTLAPELEAATAADRAFVPLDGDPRGDWTVELRFPLTQAHGGGLLNGGPAPAEGVFWSANFARAEHPLPRTGADALSLDFSAKNYTAFCAGVLKTHPTLLGTDQWSCYWEWVWQNMGATRYMHNPDLWGLLRFASSEAPKAPCRDPQYPLRHVLHNAQRAMISAFLNDGAYPESLGALARCGAACCNATTSCDPSALAVAATTPAVFNVSVAVAPGAACVDYAARTTTGGPCFTLSATFANPETGRVARGTIREDRYTTVAGDLGAGCL